jgi:hypothetical protein
MYDILHKNHPDDIPDSFPGSKRLQYHGFAISIDSHEMMVPAAGGIHGSFPGYDKHYIIPFHC